MKLKEMFNLHNNDEDLFSSPIVPNIKKDKYWDYLLIGIFILMAIGAVAMVIQAAFI